MNLPDNDRDVLVKLSNGAWATAKFDRKLHQDWVPTDSYESYDNGYSGVVLTSTVVSWQELPD